MASHIERRKFLATLGGVAAWPFAAHDCVRPVAQEGYYGVGHDRWHMEFYLKRLLGSSDFSAVKVSYKDNDEAAN